MTKSGFGIIEMLITIVIMCITMQIMTKMFTFQSNAQAHLTLRTDKEVIRRQLTQAISCSNTIGTGCTAGQTVVLKDGNNNLITSTTGTGLFAGSGLMFNNWYVKAVCLSNGTSFSVQAAKRASDSAYAKISGSTVAIDFIDNNIFNTYCNVASTTQMVSAPLTIINTNGCGSPGSILYGLFSVASVYSATAQCPTGTKLISGGVNCDVGTVYNSFPVSKNYIMGQILNSYPDTVNQRWVASCCVDSSRGNTISSSNQAYAICQ